MLLKILDEARMIMILILNGMNALDVDVERCRAA